MARVESPNHISQHVTFENGNTAHGAGTASSSSSDEAHEYDDYREDTDETPTEQGAQDKTKLAIPKSCGLYGRSKFVGNHYADFHEAFRKSFSMAQDPATFVNSANRLTLTAEDESQRSEPNELVIGSHSNVNRASVVPSKRSGSSIARASKKTKPNGRASSESERRSSTPMKKSSVDDKAPAIARSPRPKGSGIYKTGTWEYASDEDKGVEKITKVVNEISAITEASASKPAKLTRNSFRNLKSTLEISSVGTTPSQEPPPSGDRATPAATVDSGKRRSLSKASGTPPTSLRPEQSTSTRKSNRVRVIPNYSNLSVPEIDDDPPSPARSASPESARQEKTPSTLKSPVSDKSTPVPDRPRISTSASTPLQADPKPEQISRPKKSWTAMVYEILANSNIRLTLAEIGEAIKDRYPFFRSDDQAHTLKSSPRNPLYSHPAFYRIQRPDRTLEWGLNPGQFFDKRTNKLLTPGSPVADIVPSVELSEQITEKDLQQDSTTERAATCKTRISEADTRQDELVKSPALILDMTQEPMHTEQSYQRTTREVEVDVSNTLEPAKTSPHTAQNSPRPSITRIDVGSEKMTPQLSSSATLHSRDQRRLAGLVHKDLVDTFTDEEMDYFLQETKLCYFKNMALEKHHTRQILDSIFPDGLKSSEDDVEGCTLDLRNDYEERTWASDWFLDFVRGEVTKFDTNMQGFMKHLDRPKPIRLDFWVGPTKWNRKSFTTLFSVFSDTVDLDKAWLTKHWHDFARKVFSTACDATWEHRLDAGDDAAMNNVMKSIHAAIHERYPDRSAKIWDVPRLYQPRTAAGDRKASVVSTTSGRHPGSAEGSIATEKTGGGGDEIGADNILQEHQTVAVG